MTSPDTELSELERDALTELVNIGVSRAAASLRKMVGQQVLLSIPAIEAISRKTAAALIAEREDNDLVAVQQEFSGAFSGRALLIFPRASSRHLVHVVIGEEMAAEDLAEMEQEALAETGNIILNGCLASMANMLKESLKMSLPVVLRGNGAELFNVGSQPDEDGLVLFLYINFSVRNRDIRGYIAMLMDLPSLTALKRLIGDFISSVMGNSAGHGG